MERQQKVSLVVPMFKVEKYLPRCIDSILNQTYENMEVILVNDGSPDNCGEIAESYSKKDDRVIVVHKENGGLSDARNVGMQYVTGDFTLFVDSDDWLEASMLEKLVNISNKYKADIVQSAFYYAYNEYLLFDNRYYSQNDPYTILNNKELMTELIINERVKNFAWGKLYKTSIILGVPFKKGVLFEDVFWAHQVMHRVNTYVMLHQPLCYYFQRSDSIVSTYTPRNLDIIKGLKERHKFIKEFYNNLSHESLKNLVKTMLIHYNLLLQYKIKDRDNGYKKEIRSYINRNYREIIESVKKDRELKRQLILFHFHPYLNVLYLVIRKIVRKMRVHSTPVVLEKIPLVDNRRV